MHQSTRRDTTEASTNFWWGRWVMMTRVSCKSLDNELLTSCPTNQRYQQKQKDEHLHGQLQAIKNWPWTVGRPGNEARS